MDPHPTRISVVIPAYGRTELLRKALLSLFVQDLPGPDYEIIVVDSSPNDANVALVRELSQQAPCALQCLTKKPEGPGPSRNLGVLHARARFIAFMDSDCEATPGWLRQGLAAFREGIGIVQGKTLPDPTVRRGIFVHYLAIEQESFLYETANIFYRREALDQAGGFPSDLTPHAETPMGSEDTEIAWRVLRHSWKSCFCPEALVYHAVFPASIWKWLFVRRLFIFPRLMKVVPELRRHMVCFFFLDRGQALFVVFAAGVLLSFLHASALLLCLPYAVFRSLEPTMTLKGVLRPLRIIPYLMRDVISFMILLGGSLRFGALLL
jgi:cellulose synthase/poly-beta-1,6-N-acetylglucosamine synthase-like glycosyltransferase